MDDFHTGTVDVRDFIFVVVEQLSSLALGKGLGLKIRIVCYPQSFSGVLASFHTSMAHDRLQRPKGPAEKEETAPWLHWHERQRARNDPVDGVMQTQYTYIIYFHTMNYIFI